MPPGPPGALNQVAAVAPVIQEIQQSTIQVLRLLQKLRQMPGVDVKQFDQGATMMSQGLNAVAASMPRPRE